MVQRSHSMGAGMVQPCTSAGKHSGLQGYSSSERYRLNSTATGYQHDAVPHHYDEGGFVPAAGEFLSKTPGYYSSGGRQCRNAGSGYSFKDPDTTAKFQNNDEDNYRETKLGADYPLSSKENNTTNNEIIYHQPNNNTSHQENGGTYQRKSTGLQLSSDGYSLNTNGYHSNIANFPSTNDCYPSNTANFLSSNGGYPSNIATFPPTNDSYSNIALFPPTNDGYNEVASAGYPPSPDNPPPTLYQPTSGASQPTQVTTRDAPHALYQQFQGKVVIRPIAYRPAAPSPAQLAHGLPSPCGPIAGVGGRPPQDPRYTSTPALARGTAPHYGSLGDLKSLGYSLDRRGFGTPLIHGPPPTTEPPQHMKHASMTHLHHSDHHSDFRSHHQTHTKNSNNAHANSIYVNTTNTSINNPNLLHINNLTIHNNNNNSNLSNNSSSKNESLLASHNNSDSNNTSANPDLSGTSSIISRPSSSHHSHKSTSEANSSLNNSISPQICHPPQSNNNINSNTGLHVPSNNNRVAPVIENPSSRFDNHKSLISTSDVPNQTSNHSGISTSTTLHQHHFHHLHHHHHRMGGSVSNLSRIGTAPTTGSSSLALDRSASVTGTNMGLNRTGGSISGSMTELDDPHQTPSPSDSGVAELEAILREKDSEISLLKESMEQSEQIIFKVYEEKEKTWERELKKIRDSYEARLKSSQQKVLTMEQTITSQAYQLQQERRKVSSEVAEAKREREAGRGQQSQLQAQTVALRSQLEETEWGLCQKAGEISLLKSQLKDCQGDQTTRGHELLHLRAQLRQYAHEVERRRAEITSLHELTATLRKETAELRAEQQRSKSGTDTTRKSIGEEDATVQLKKAMHELQLLREERERDSDRLTEERSRWQQEKESVLRYQRQLQLACTHAQRTNRRLHGEIERLNGQSGKSPQSSVTPPPAIPPLPPGYTQAPSPPPPPPGVLSEEALC